MLPLSNDFVERHHPLNRGLVAWWLALPVLAGGDKLYDIVGQNHGVLTNGTAWSRTGKPGGVGSLSFDGTDDYVDCGNIPAITNKLTIAFWFRRPGNGYKVNVGKWVVASYSYQLEVWSDNKLYLDYSSDGSSARYTVSTSTIGTDSEWHHACGVYDGDATTAVLYFDGKVLASTQVGGGVIPSLYQSTTPLIIGKYGLSYTTGNVDDVRIYNRAISAGETRALFDESRTGNTSTLSPVPWYRDTPPAEPEISLPLPPLGQDRVERHSSLNNGLVSWWVARPDLAGGNKFHDLVGNSHVSLVAGTSWSRTGKPGGDGALSFDGVDDYAEMPTGEVNAALDSAAWTISLWGYISSTCPDIAFLFGRRSGTNSRVIAYKWNTTGLRCGYESVGYAITHSSFSDVDVWKHICWTYSSGANTLYIDGVSVASNTYASPASYSGNYRFGNAAFKGLLDDVRVYKRTLSAGEVRVLYDESRSDALARPQAWFSDPAIPPPPPLYPFPPYLPPPVPLSPVESLVPLLPDLVERTSPLNRGLVSWWLAVPGLDGGAKLHDLVGMNHGVLTNGVAWKGTTRLGGYGALLFDGSHNVAIGVAPSLNILTSITVSAWVMMKSLPGSRCDVVYNYWFYYLDITSSGKVEVYQYGTTPSGWHSSTSTVSINTWNHIGYTYGNGSLSIYINGVLDKSVSVNGNIGISTPSPVAIGGYDGTRSVNGLIDDVRIYNRSLTPSEVRGLFDESRSGSRTTLRYIPAVWCRPPGLGIDPPFALPPYVPPPSSPPKAYSLPAPVITHGSLSQDWVDKYHPLSQGLVAWWLALPGLDGGKKVYDLVGMNHGTLTNMTTGASGWRASTRPGGYGGLLFDGANDQIDVATVFNQTTVTVAVWARRSGAGIQHIVNNTPSGYTSGFDLRYIGVNDFRCIFCGSLTTSDELTTTYNVDTNWHHYTMSYNGATVRLYVDGVQIGSRAVAGYVPAVNALTIGQGTRNPGVWSGQIDDLRIYNRALSADEVRALYHDSLLGNTNLRGYPVPLGEEVRDSPNPVTFGVKTELALNDVVERSSPLNQGLVALWKVLPGLEGSRMLPDLMGLKHGILTNGVAWSRSYKPGGVGYLTFDGIDDHILTSLQFAPGSGKFSLAGWWRGKGANDNGVVIGARPASYDSSQSTYSLHHGNFNTGGATKQYSFGVYQDASNYRWVLSSSSLDNGEWHHLVGVSTGEQLFLYVDGKAVGVSSGAAGAWPNITTAGFVGMGAGNDAASPVEGDGDDFRVYNRALSADEVRTLYEDSLRDSPDSLRRFSLRVPSVPKYELTCRATTEILLNDVVERSSPLNQGLVAWWLALPGLDGGAKFHDLVGMNHGVLTNGATWSRNSKPGWVGSLSFDGADDYAVVQNVQPPTGYMSLSVWFKANSLNSGIAGWNGNSTGTSPYYERILYIDNVNFQVIWYVFYGGASYLASTPAAYNDGKWHHAVGVVDGGSIKLYMDGKLVATSGTAVPEGYVYSSTPSFLIGKTGGSRQLNGCVDDVRIYNRALTAGEVRALYDDSRRGHPETLRRLSFPVSWLPNYLAVSPPPCTELMLHDVVNRHHPLNQGLVSWWLALPGLDGGAKLHDLVGMNHGTLTNGAAFKAATRPGGFGALAFDGVNDYVATTNSDFGTTQGTISAWVRTSSPSTTSQGIFFCYGGDAGPWAWNTAGKWYLILRSTLSGLCRVELYQNSDGGGETRLVEAANYSNPDGVWLHVTVVASGASWKLYKNGVKQGNWIVVSGSDSGTWVGSTSVGSPRSVLGCSYIDGVRDYYLKGEVDDVRVYNRALSDGEARAVYEDSRRGHPETLNRIPAFTLWEGPHAPDTSPTTTPVSPRWNTRVTAELSRSVPWHTRISASNQTELDWRALQSLTGLSQLAWMTRQAVSLERQFPSHTRVLAASSLSQPWRTRVTAADSLGLGWGVRSTLAGVLEAVWHDRAVITDAAALQWNARILAGNEALLRWADRAAVTSAIDHLWRCRSLVGVDFYGVWRVRQLAGGGVETRWRDLALAVADASLLWSLDGPGRVIWEMDTVMALEILSDATLTGQIDTETEMWGD